MLILYKTSELHVIETYFAPLDPIRGTCAEPACKPACKRGGRFTWSADPVTFRLYDPEETGRCDLLDY